ncbi:MAG: EscU/YscU/HrcU family type III secretion system export apparatus switch protein [Methyloligellaceae bacterium]
MTNSPDDMQKKAVALHYDHEHAPYVTAKGQGEVARRIIEKAREHDIPIEEDPLLTQALSHIPLDEEIPEELYKAVAAVLRYIMKTRGSV